MKKATGQDSKLPGELKRIEDDPNKAKKHSKKKGKASDTSSEEEATDDEKDKSNKPNAAIKDLIAEHFVLLTLIGKGAFGQIILSFNTREEIEVAIKKEQRRVQKAPQLRTEAKVYCSLLDISTGDITGVKALSQQTVQGVPKFYGMGETLDFFYLIMEFLGPNLVELLNYCKTRKFTISTVCLIALQLINRIEYIHKHHYIHRDIKPENFLIGIQEKSNIIYAIDFGLSKRYKNPKNHQHIPYREGRLLTGTARYVSINTHLGIEQSRRDDMESLGYVLVFFLKGSLPWQGLKMGNDKYVRIMEKKLQIPTEILCHGLPDEMIFYLNYCKSLRFEDRPDYDYLRGLFIKLLGTCSSLYGVTKEYLKFDWSFKNPTNSIWLLYSQSKKGKLIDDQNKETTLSASVKNNKNFSNSHLLNLKDKNGMGKQLSNIEEGKVEENNVKTNENNPFISNSNDSEKDSSDLEAKSEDEGSVDTVKEAFYGFNQTDPVRNELSIEEEPNEDIDKYINKLFIASQFLGKIHCDTPLSKKESQDTPVMGGKNKAKIRNSLEISPMTAEIIKKKSKFDTTKHNSKANDCQSDDEDEEDAQMDQVVIKNTIRNSKILSLEEMNRTVLMQKEKGAKPRTRQIRFKSTKEKDSFDQDKKAVTAKKDETPDSSLSSIDSGFDKSKSKTSNLPIQSNSSNKANKADSFGQPTDPPLAKKETDLKLNQKFGKAEEPALIKVTTGGGKSFESEIIPKISNPEIKERRKSKILGMNIVPQIQEMKVSKEQMIKISNEQLSKFYVVENELGHGSYGKVRRVHHKQLGEDRAMKIVNKRSDSSQNEIDILRKISHPNIVNVFEIYEDSKKFYIMTELLEGGELFEVITSQGSFSELDAMKILKQLLNAVNYLHSRSIVHRDLKPENIMLTSKSKEHQQKYEIKIIDFGSAVTFEPNKKLNKFIGTSYYIAPEVLKESYDEKCDIWSCGVILYILLCGYPPFNGSSSLAIYHSIEVNQPIFAGEGWKEAPEAVDLIKKMLVKVPSKRLNAQMCLNHPWFKLFDANDKAKETTNKKVQISVISKMAEFVTQNRFKQAVLQFISTQFNLKKEEERLRELFKQLDTAKKGQITKEAFCEQLCRLYGENDGKEICSKIFEHLDLDGSGEISYDEFVSSMIDGRKVLTRERLEKAFKMFDKDGNGRLSIEEIIGIFGGDEKSWKAVIKEVDLNNDGEVDLEEFKSMMINIDKKIFFGEDQERE